MSNENFELTAEFRTLQGKGASRRLRKTGLVPGIVYGGEEADPQVISLNHNELKKHLENEAFFFHILQLNLGGKAQSVVLKDIQRHPYRAEVMHIDFLRVSATQMLKMTVPVHFLGEESAKAVKQQGGVVSHLLNEVEIECRPADLPEFLTLDVSELEMGHPLHLSDIALPEGVRIPGLALGEGHDLAVVVINQPKVVVEAEPVEGAEPEEAAGEEPEEEG
ncbi:MAG: 50S ribosomal protein L25/general stress protein Ctc [Gammaproteobacteria bacterium]|nr:50S ribosomal protein L25/general stress protein Ctc [Gammaproteobacteria bacterium]